MADKEEKGVIDDVQDLLVSTNFLTEDSQKQEAGKWGPQTAQAWRNAITHAYAGSPHAASLQTQPHSLDEGVASKIEEAAVRLEEQEEAAAAETEAQPEPVQEPAPNTAGAQPTDDEVKEFSKAHLRNPKEGEENGDSLVEIAEAEGVSLESDDNKDDIARKILSARLNKAQ